MPSLRLAARRTFVAMFVSSAIACGGGDGDGEGAATPRTELSPAAFLSVPSSASASSSTSSASSSAAVTYTSTPSGPTISGSPVSVVRVGEEYSFRPTATDANGDTLQFTAQNLPAWANFDSSTGQITGTPTDEDIGASTAVQITVSDGASSATLPMDISVVQFAHGTAELSWTPPVATIDGEPLSDLAGYRIKFGRVAQDLDQSIVIENPSVTGFVVDNLTPGTWYFTVVAINSASIEGAPAQVASKVVI